MSKLYSGKDCAYCGKQRTSTTADHVIAREFFFKGDRGNFPKVPACEQCNHEKSKLEHYVTAVLMVGSQLPEGDRYRREMVSPRLARNLKLMREVGFFDRPELVNANGVIQPMRKLKVDANKLMSLMGLITKGLYYHHFRKPLSPDFCPHVVMLHPDREADVWSSMAHLFPPGVPKVNGDLGHGTFIYAGMRSVANEAFSVWEMAFHNGIPLHGDGSPPQGIDKYWSATVPTAEALAQERSG